MRKRYILFLIVALVALAAQLLGHGNLALLIGSGLAIGMIDNDAYFDAAAEVHKAVFFSALEKQDMGDVGKLAMLTTADDKALYPWLKSLPRMSKFVDETKFQKLEAGGITIINDVYTAGIEVSKDDFRKDRLGLITPRLKSMASAAEYSKMELLRTLLNGAFTTSTSWDGVALCGAHTGVTNGVTTALATTAVTAAIKVMREAKDAEGKELNITPTHIIVGADKEGWAKQLYASDRDPDDTDKANPWKGTLQVLVVPFLTANYWFIADLSKELKPLILQSAPSETKDKQEVKGLILWNENGVEFLADYNELGSRRVIKYAAEAVFNAGVGFHQLIYGSTGAG